MMMAAAAAGGAAVDDDGVCGCRISISNIVRNLSISAATMQHR